MAQDLTVNKNKFDTLLRTMLATPPLPKAEVKVRRKAKKRKRSAA
jgi:hypothetical protein